MKNLILTCISLIYLNSFAQNKEQAEASFLKELNILFADTKANDEGIGFPDKKTILAPFTINKNGILSVAIKRSAENGSFEISKMEVPIKKIKQVVYDLYLILKFQDDAVTWTTFEPDGKTIKETIKSSLLHIGIPLPEDERHKVKLQKLVDEVLQFY